jgi:D-alanyl-D-alanine carboxypeptidase
VKKMNALAAKLGMKHTHYADASGLNPGSRSTAMDQATLGAYAMGIPGLVSIVDHPTMFFPVEGTVMNYNPVVGLDGVIGLKSGFTSAAQGCLVTAARRTIGGHSVLIVSATLTQVLGLPEAGQLDLQLLNAATSALEARPILHTGQPVAKVVAGWTHERPTVVVAGDPATVVGWAGLKVKTVVTPSVRAALGPKGWTTGTPMALVEVSTPGGLQSFAFGTIDRHLRPAPPGWSPSSGSGSVSSPAASS